MKEDIEILVRHVGYMKYENYKYCENAEEVKVIKAIENLIKGYKELERKLVIAENTKHTCPYIPTSGVTCDVKELEESISKEYKLGFAQAEYETNEDWKFKITEKIDELKDKLWRLQIQFNELKNYTKKEEFLSEQLKIWGAIQILEEILGGKQ